MQRAPIFFFLLPLLYLPHLGTSHKTIFSSIADLLNLSSLMMLTI
ncbi:hypothetical protein RJ641_014601 [Dillenia turbinata]|uniref:NADH dehydrogenase subunit 4 n=1 Tax=Dillenia turbinata TaxID=194707 RepID=A0AAN8V3U4_9MAGN